MEWQEIESAPKDETEILLCELYDDGSSNICIGYWADSMDEWRGDGPYGIKATHWQPLPPPPGDGER